MATKKNASNINTKTVAPAAKTVASTAKVETKVTEDKKADVKVTEVKGAAKEVKPVVKAEEKKEAPKKAAAPKKVAEKKETVKKTAEKKEVAPKSTAKKTDAKVLVQFAGKEIDTATIVENAKADYVANGGKKTGIKDVTIYVKPEDFTAYYVIDGTEGKVNL